MFNRRINNKYGNTKTVIDGITFDSKKEANRYLELKLLQKGKKISSLETQPKFILQKKFTTQEGKKEREITYIADFMYCEISDLDHMIIEDVKGVKTESYKIKRKLLLFKYPHIRFREI